MSAPGDTGNEAETKAGRMAHQLHNPMRVRARAAVRVWSRCLAAALMAGSVLAPAAATAQKAKNAEELSKIAQGTRWLRICSSDRRVDEATCNGFIMGLEETQFLAEFKPLYCPPPRFTVEEQKKIIVKYLKEHPGRHNEPFARLAADAMRAAYPCNK